MPLDGLQETLFWNRPDEPFQKGISGPGCRAVLNDVMDTKSWEVSLSELDKILITIDAREGVRGKVSHFLAKNTPYNSSFSYIGCSQGGILLRDDTSGEFFVIECIDGKVFKTILPNSGQNTWSDLHDRNRFEYIDLGFMFSIQTSYDKEQRRRIFFDGARKGFAGRKNRKVTSKSTNGYKVYEVTLGKIRELTLAEISDEGFNNVDY